MRSTGDLNPQERNKHLVLNQIINDTYRTDKEREEAKRELDKMMHSGDVGLAESVHDAYSQRLSAIEERLTTLENKKSNAGRPRNRYYVTGSRGSWVVMDSDKEEPTGDKMVTRAEADDRCRQLNKGTDLFSLGDSDEEPRIRSYD
jgi:hypothetical protein